MTQVIVWKQDNGVAAIFHPTQEAIVSLGMKEIASRIVPKNKPYKFIDASDIPSDRSMRNAWTIDDADLIDGIGGQ